MKFTSSTCVYAVAAAGLIILATGAYYNGLQGPFLFDDVTNILRVPANALQELNFPQLRDVAFTTGADYPDRALSRLSFAFNYYFAGGEYNVLAFKLTNLGIHLLNALLLWFIAHRLLARFAALRGLDEMVAGRPWWQWAAFFSALIWALHPLQLTAVLYIVQRMTSLSALFTLLGLAVWIGGRERLEAGRRGALLLMSAGLLFGLVLGILSKENAVLLPYYALLTEWVFFRREKLTKPALNTLRGFFVLFAVVPALVAAGLIVSNWESITALYQGRNFTLGERLLTESRILWFYLQLLVFPDAQNFGIYHDDIALSRDLLSPWTTLTSVLGWILALGLAVAGLFKHRLFSFAVLWYLIGQSIESSFIALELVFEHRNYLPIAGVIVVLSVYLVRALIAVSDKPSLHLGVPGLIILVLSGVTFSRANIWQYPYTIMYIGIKNHPDSPRFHRGFASQLSQIDADEKDIFEHLQTAVRLSPGDASGLFEMSRILNRRLLNAGIPRRQSPVAVNGVDVFNDPLPEEVPAMQAYDAAIDKEVLRRAREEVLIVNASEIGRYSQSCLNTGNPLCDRMQDMVVVWIKAISENPRQFPKVRAQSALAYARIMAASGDTQAAIEGVDEAIRLTSESTYFRIEKAQLYLALNQLDAADKVLDEARQYLHWSGYNRQAFVSLRKQIQQMRETQSGNGTLPGSPD